VRWMVGVQNQGRRSRRTVHLYSLYLLFVLLLLAAAVAAAALRKEDVSASVIPKACAAPRQSGSTSLGEEEGREEGRKGITIVTGKQLSFSLPFRPSLPPYLSITPGVANGPTSPKASEAAKSSRC